MATTVVGQDLSGCSAGSAPTAKVTVGATSTAVVSANTDRIGLILTNDSDEVIYLAFGAAAVLNQGARLNAGGGSCTLDRNLGYTGAVTAICTSGSKNLCVVEF